MRFFGPALVLSVLMVAGCDTDAPLSDPSTSILDEALLGHWSGLHGDTSLHLFVGRHVVVGNPESIVEILGIEIDPKSRRFESIADSQGTNPIPRLYGSFTRIKDQAFLSVFFSGGNPADLSSENSFAKWSHDPKRNCVTIRYQTDGQQLRFATMTGDDFEKAANRGDLRQKDGLVTAESLVAYVERTGGRSVFNDEPVTFQKLP